MQDKEALVRAHAFPAPPIFLGTKYKPKQGNAHLAVAGGSVGKALLCQLVKKAPGPNMHNFWTVSGYFGYYGTGTQIVSLQLLFKPLHCNIIYSNRGLQKEFFWKSLIKEIALL